MKPTCHRTSAGPGSGFVLTVVLSLFLLAASATASDKDERRHPGQVDATRFLELADPDGDLVEVSLHGRLLRLLTKRAIRRADADLAAILEPLERVHAVIASVRSSRVDETREQVAAVARRLDREGWERFVRVRESGQELTAYIHLTGRDDEEEIDGIVVMGFTDERELLFVNLAGRIDLERIALLGTRMGVPGLDGLPSQRELDDHRHLDRHSGPSKGTKGGS